MQFLLTPSNFLPPVADASVFLKFNLPDATTWFYFSLLLAIALFFKFSRFFSVRNLDVLMAFLLVPGLLLLRPTPPEPRPVEAPSSSSLAPNESIVKSQPESPSLEPQPSTKWFGYLWLLLGSGYLLLRCLLDLILVRRPALSPNLNLGGLAWLAAALFVCLAVVAFRPMPDVSPTLSKPGPVLGHAQATAAGFLQGQADAAFIARSCLALLCHLLVVSGLIVIGCRHFQDAHTGMAAATFYLLLPYTAMNVGQWHHVWPMALFVWAVAAYRIPTVAGLLVGLAAGTMYFPALTLPVWCSFYWRRGTARFAVAFVLAAGIPLAILGSILSTNGQLPGSLQAVLALSDWQPWSERSTESFWTGWVWAYRMPVFIAYVAFVATTTIWPAPKNLAHLLALSAAVLIGVQFWFAEKGGVYVLWYLPLVLLLAFRPNLSDRRPPTTPPGTDWLSRFLRFAGRLGYRLVRPPETSCPRALSWQV